MDWLARAVRHVELVVQPVDLIEGAIAVAVANDIVPRTDVVIPGIETPGPEPAVGGEADEAVTVRVQILPKPGLVLAIAIPVAVAVALGGVGYRRAVVVGALVPVPGIAEPVTIQILHDHNLRSRHGGHVAAVLSVGVRLFGAIRQLSGVAQMHDGKLWLLSCPARRPPAPMALAEALDAPFAENVARVALGGGLEYTRQTRESDGLADCIGQVFPGNWATLSGRSQHVVTGFRDYPAIS